LWLKVVRGRYLSKFLQIRTWRQVLGYTVYSILLVCTLVYSGRPDFLEGFQLEGGPLNSVGSIPTEIEVLHFTDSYLATDLKVDSIVLRITIRVYLYYYFSEFSRRFPIK
jgi:hypothetical protein